MARFAPTRVQVDAVTGWLHSRGLRVTGISKDDLLVYVESPTAAVERALGVQVGEYTLDGDRFFAADRGPTVPDSLPILAVSGLSDYERPHATAVCEEELCGFTGNELRTVYHVAGSAEGQTLAFTLYGAPLPETTYEHYAAATDTPVLRIGPGAEEIEFKEVGGKSGSEGSDTFGETAGDTEVAHVIAPQAHELFFMAKNNEETYLDEAVSEARRTRARGSSPTAGAPTPAAARSRSNLRSRKRLRWGRRSSSPLVTTARRGPRASTRPRAPT